ncbi:hypothetical protein, partial [Rhodoplanes roseus]|uniref:hypothetical protein n=1 Tax=Rhodoplanes roseus TaxID=29409 RepID=UPI001AECD523
MARTSIAAGIVVAVVLGGPAGMAQTAAPPPAKPAAKPAAAKPAAAKPASAKPSPAKPAAAKPAATAKPPAETGPCELGVVSVVGHLFTRQKVGITVFGNEHDTLPSSAWGLDDVVAARVRAAAGAGVRRIAVPPGAFDAYEKPARALFRNANDDLLAAVRTVTASTRCARYLVVTRGSSAFSSTNQTVAGLGIVNYGAPLRSRSYVFALTAIRLYDGASLALLATEVSQLRERTLGDVLMGGLIRGPFEEVDDGLWPETPQTPIAPGVRSAARDLLVLSLDRTLPRVLGVSARAGH